MVGKLIAGHQTGQRDWIAGTEHRKSCSGRHFGPIVVFGNHPRDLHQIASLGLILIAENEEPAPGSPFLIADHKTVIGRAGTGIKPFSHYDALHRHRLARVRRVSTGIGGVLNVVATQGCQTVDKRYEGQ